MTAEEFKEIQSMLGLSNKGMADLISRRERAVGQYRNAEVPIPELVAKFLRLHLKDQAVA